MNATLYLNVAEAVAAECVTREARRHGLSRDIARDRVAGQIGCAPGTLYNLLRGRLKKIDADLRERLTNYAIGDLQHEIEALSRELESARRLGRPQGPEMAAKAARVLEEAQALHARIAAEAQ